MLRTTLSICALFGSLILVSKWLHESNQPATPALLPMPTGEPAIPARSADRTGKQPAKLVRDAAIQRIGYEEDEDLSAVLDELRRDLRITEEAAFDPFADPVLDSRRIERGEDEAPSEESDATEADPGIEATDSTKPGEGAENADDAKPVETESAETRPAKPVEPEIAMTSELLELRDKIRRCLAHYYFRPENVATRSPWGCMHWMIAYGVDSELITTDRKVNAIGYLCFNGTCNGQRLFQAPGGKIHAPIGPGMQGHPGQFLAMLAQSRVKSDFPMRIDGQDFTVADLIDYEKRTCKPGIELTFKLLALSHYLKSDETWKSDDGQDWDIQRLIKEELKQPINGAACGGTHRMMGFSYAARKREQRGEPMEGQWKRAQKFVDDYHEYTFKLQNADGSFSTEWFVRRAEHGDLARRVQTTGHTAEWLSYSLSKPQLVEPRMIHSMDYLTTALAENPNEKWSIGPLGHALHALAIYDERVFGGKPGQRAEQLAEVRRTEFRVER